MAEILRMQRHGAASAETCRDDDDWINRCAGLTRMIIWAARESRDVKMTGVADHLDLAVLGLAEQCRNCGKCKMANSEFFSPDNKDDFPHMG